MTLEMAMAAYQMVGSAVTSYTGSRAAKKVASAQKATAEKAFAYNKDQISKAYSDAYANTMSNYVDNRKKVTSQYNKAKSDLNMYISKNSINLEDSSYFGESENQLDSEFNTNLQTLFGNLVSQTGAIASNKVSQEYQLGNQFLNQKQQINNTLNNVNSALLNDVVNKVGNFATEVVSDYKASEAKGGDDYSLGDYFENFSL